MKKHFYQPFITIRSKWNPMRYILGKEKYTWGIKATDYWIDNLDLDVKDIKFIKKS